jgi:membrane-bound ClpP family serine protease
MFLAIAILLLALIGILPIQYALPLALASTAFGAVTFWLMQRRLARIPLRNGLEAMIGSVSPALTNIERDGQIRFGNEIWNARAEGRPVRKGERVRIVGVVGLRAVVTPEDSADG